jgi:folylpolyglutamate synthase/dihydropteroate synthase
MKGNASVEQQTVMEPEEISKQEEEMHLSIKERIKKLEEEVELERRFLIFPSFFLILEIAKWRK